MSRHRMWSDLHQSNYMKYIIYKIIIKQCHLRVFVETNHKLYDQIIQKTKNESMKFLQPHVLFLPLYRQRHTLYHSFSSEKLFRAFKIKGAMD